MKKSLRLTLKLILTAIVIGVFLPQKIQEYQTRRGWILRKDDT